MLELRTYTKAEMAAILGTPGRQGMTNRLRNYGVAFRCQGNADNLKITITAIPDPFKVFCILELGFAPQCDFRKMRNFFWYYFQDDEFRSLPDEVLENRVKDQGQVLTRQTIAKWRVRLADLGLIWLSTKDFIYYFAYKDTQRMTTREEYSQAWHDYWADKDEGYDSWVAIMNMREKYGGVARKQPKAELNGIYVDSVVSPMLEYIQESIENEMDN